MVSQYRVKAPISAILDKPDGGTVTVKIPAGAVLHKSSTLSTTLMGIIGVYWESRHYSVYPNDLLVKAERVESA